MPVTLNPSDKTADITLSGSDLTAESVSAAVDQQVRATAGVAVGEKRYWEVTVDNTAGSGSWGHGVANLNHLLTDGAGFDANHSVCCYITGTYRNSGVISTTLGHASGFGALVNGDVVSFAVDGLNHLLWVRINGGNWCSNAAEDPATAAGGFDLTVLGGDTLYPIFDFSNNTQQGTVAFDSGSWAFSPPAGFTKLVPQVPAGRTVGGEVIYNPTAISGGARLQNVYGVDFTATFGAITSLDGTEVTQAITGLTPTDQVLVQCITDPPPNGMIIANARVSDTDELSIFFSTAEVGGITLGPLDFRVTVFR